MTAAVITLAAGYPAAGVVTLLFARAGVVSLHVRRPPKPRQPKMEATS